jgi:hypothetical protein
VTAAREAVESVARVQAEAATWEPGSLGGGAWEVALEVGSRKHSAHHVMDSNPRFLRVQGGSAASGDKFYGSMYLTLG